PSPPPSTESNHKPRLKTNGLRAIRSGRSRRLADGRLSEVPAPSLASNPITRTRPLFASRKNLRVACLRAGILRRAKGGVILKKRLIVLLALAVVIAAAVVSTASAALVDNGGLWTVTHSGRSVFATRRRGGARGAGA